MAIKGAILGDISGSRCEAFVDMDWPNSALFNDQCTFTDDTVMSLAVKQALIKKKSYISAMQELGKMYFDVGFGPSFSIKF